MPETNVNTKVGVGALGSVDNHTTIGTDGLTICVGVIAVGTPPGQQAVRRTCAHFSSGFGGAPSEEKIAQAIAATTLILEANFDVNSIWGYANHTPREWTATAIIEACTTYFKNAANPATREAESIYTDGGGTIHANFNYVVGENSIENEDAEVNPPVAHQA